MVRQRHRYRNRAISTRFFAAKNTVEAIQFAMMEPTLSAHRLMFSDITDALRTGQIVFRAIPAASCAFAAVLAGFGMALLSAITALGFSPMALPFAGGFMLVGPILLTGFLSCRGGTRSARNQPWGMPSVPLAGTERTLAGCRAVCLPIPYLGH